MVYLSDLLRFGCKRQVELRYLNPPSSIVGLRPDPGAVSLKTGQESANFPSEEPGGKPPQQRHLYNGPCWKIRLAFQYQVVVIWIAGIDTIALQNLVSIDRRLYTRRTEPTSDILLTIQLERSTRSSSCLVIC